MKKQAGPLLRVAADGVHPREGAKKGMLLCRFPVQHPHALEIREEALFADTQGNRFDGAVRAQLSPEVSPREEMLQDLFLSHTPEAAPSLRL